MWETEFFRCERPISTTRRSCWPRSGRTYLKTRTAWQRVVGTLIPGDTTHHTPQAPSTHTHTHHPLPETLQNRRHKRNSSSSGCVPWREAALVAPSSFILSTYFTGGVGGQSYYALLRQLRPHRRAVCCTPICTPWSARLGSSLSACGKGKLQLLSFASSVPWLPCR